MPVTTPIYCHQMLWQPTKAMEKQALVWGIGIIVAAAGLYRLLVLHFCRCYLLCGPVVKCSMFYLGCKRSRYLLSTIHL